MINETRRCRRFFSIVYRSRVKIKILPCLKPSLPCLLCGRANVSSEAKINIDVRQHTIRSVRIPMNISLALSLLRTAAFSLTLRRGTGRRFQFSLDSRQRWFRGVSAVLRRFVSPPRRARGRRRGGIVGGRDTRHTVGGATRGLAAASHAVAARFALEVQAHLHLHHLRRALDEIGARARLQVLTGGLADRRVRRAAQLPRSATFPLRRGQRRPQQRVARHVVEPLL